MIAVAASIWAAVYLLIPSLLFDKIVSIFVPARKIARSRTDEFLYGLLIALIPLGIVWILSHSSYFFGHYPFSLPPAECSLKWNDYHNVVLAFSSDSFFKEQAPMVWDSVGRIRHHQERFLLWMYLVLGLQITVWVLLLKHFGQLQKFPLFKKYVAPLLIGRVSEWHVLLTAFVFPPAENRTVFVDIVTPDGLYKGKVRNYFTNNDGALSGILLDDTRRFRKAEYDDEKRKWREKGSPGQKPATDTYWSKIAGGTHLYIPADRIGNLNVRYEKPEGIKETDILRSLANEQVLKSLIERLNSQSKELTVTLTRPPLGNKQLQLTREDFKQRAVRTETGPIVSYDLRPFGSEQQHAAAFYLGDLIFRQSIGTLKPSGKSVVLTVDEAYKNTPQIDGFIRKLKATGLRVSIESSLPKT